MPQHEVSEVSLFWVALMVSRKMRISNNLSECQQEDTLFEETEDLSSVSSGLVLNQRLKTTLPFTKLEGNAVCR